MISCHVRFGRPLLELPGIRIEQSGTFPNMLVQNFEVNSFQRDDTRNLDIEFGRSDNRTALIQAVQTVRQLCQFGQHHTDHSPAHSKLQVEEIGSANLPLQMHRNRHLANDNSSDDPAWVATLQTSNYRWEWLGRTIFHPNSRGFHP